jgi:hypothetical protein
MQLQAWKRLRRSKHPSILAQESPAPDFLTSQVPMCPRCGQFTKLYIHSSTLRRPKNRDLQMHLPRANGGSGCRGDSDHGRLLLCLSAIERGREQWRPLALQSAYQRGRRGARPSTLTVTVGLADISCGIGAAGTSSNIGLLGIRGLPGMTGLPGIECSTARLACTYLLPQCAAPGQAAPAENDSQNRDGI